MSPWWRDRAVVRISPDAVLLTRLGRGFRRAPIASETLAVAPSGGAPAWRAGIDVLAALLQREASWRAGGLVLEVAAPLCRWMLLPPNSDIATDEEWEALARLEFEAIHGERARDWDVRLGEQTPGGAVPACAIDRGLVEAARALCAGARMKLESVVPVFAVVFNAHRAALRAPVSALAHLDGDRVSIGVLNRGQWLAITGARLNGSPAGVLERELIGIASQGLLPSGERRLYVVDDTREAQALPARLGDWDVVVRTQSSGEPSAGRGRRVAAARTGA